MRLCLDKQHLYAPLGLWPTQAPGVIHWTCTCTCGCWVCLLCVLCFFLFLHFSLPQYSVVVYVHVHVQHHCMTELTNDIAREFGTEHFLNVSANLHFFSPASSPKILHSCNLIPKSDNDMCALGSAERVYCVCTCTLYIHLYNVHCIYTVHVYTCAFYAQRKAHTLYMYPTHVLMHMYTHTQHTHMKYMNIHVYMYIVHVHMYVYT